MKMILKMTMYSLVISLLLAFAVVGGLDLSVAIGADAAPISLLSHRIRVQSACKLDAKNVLQPATEQQPEALTTDHQSLHQSLLGVQADASAPVVPALPVTAVAWMNSVPTRSLEPLRNVARLATAYTREYAQVGGAWDANVVTNTQRMDGLFVFTTDDSGRVTHVDGPVQYQPVKEGTNAAASVKSFVDAVYYADNVAGRDANPGLLAAMSAWTAGHIISPTLSITPQRDANNHAINFFPQIAISQGGHWFTGETIAASLATEFASSACVQVAIGFEYSLANVAPVNRPPLARGAAQVFYVPVGGTYTVRVLATCPALQNHGGRSLQTWYNARPVVNSDTKRIGLMIAENPANLNVIGQNVALTLHWANQHMITGVNYKLAALGPSVPIFATPHKRNWPVNVPAGTSNIYIQGAFAATPTTGPAHTVTIAGTPTLTNTWTNAIALQVGLTEIQLKSNYEFVHTIKVTRPQAVTNFRFICNGAVTNVAVVVANVLQTAYAVNIPNAAASCTLAVTYSIGAITVNHAPGPLSTQATAALPMAVGATAIVVTSSPAGDGATFTITVNRAAH